MVGPCSNSHAGGRLVVASRNLPRLIYYGPRGRFDAKFRNAVEPSFLSCCVGHGSVYGAGHFTRGK